MESFLVRDCDLRFGDNQISIKEKVVSSYRLTKTILSETAISLLKPFFVSLVQQTTFKVENIHLHTRVRS